MKFTSNFKKLSKDDSDIAGGKGASLGEMTQVGISVPPGFVVLSTAFNEFINQSNLAQEIFAVLEKVDNEKIHTVDFASEKIQNLIKNTIIPENIISEIKTEHKKLDAKFVAVRSSATAEDGTDSAWAGQLDTFLNVKEDELIEKIRLCWASLFTSRAIFYRFERGLHNTSISVAVIIQKMIDSEISGIAFSVHPVTEDRNQVIVEAGFGLGEAIVSGYVTPDSYVVEKEQHRIINISIANKTKGLFALSDGGSKWMNICEPKSSMQVLKEEQILEIVKVVLKIEKHHGFPCDVEWVFENGNFYIVQSRPITTLSRKSSSIPDTKDKFSCDI